MKLRSALFFAIALSAWSGAAHAMVVAAKPSPMPPVVSQAQAATPPTISPATPSVAPAKTITIAADEWCPINCTPNSGTEGIGIDLARAVFESQGYRVNYVTMPWARALEEVRKGTIDAAVGANTSDDPTLVFPQSPLYTVDDGYYVKKDAKINFSGVDSLEKYRLGVIQDYGYSDELQKLLEKQKRKEGMVQETSGEDALQQNIRKLQAGRIDVLVESNVVMGYTLRNLKLESEIVPVGYTKQGFVYLAFSPARTESKALVALYDAGVTKLRKEKKLGEMYLRYNLKPLPGIWP